MHALSCSSSLEKSTVASRLVTRTRERLAQLGVHDCPTDRRCACLDPNCFKESPDRFSLDFRHFRRGEYRSDQGTSSERPF